MASLFTNGKFQAENATGPVPGAKLYTYAAGTTTPLATYTLQNGSTPNANPVICNAAGQASVWAGSSAYRMILKDASDVTIWDMDNYTAPMSAVDLTTDDDPDLGAGLIGYDVTTEYTSGVGRKLRESVSVMDYIPEAYHAAILAYTSTVDVSSYFNAALADAYVVKVPAGGYYTRYPINLSGRRVSSAIGRSLIGDGVSNTIINAYTGNYPAIDALGNSGGELSGINVRSDNASYAAGLTAADCASIGVMMGRGLVNTASNEFKVKDFRFNGHTDMARNGAFGTIGICNNGAEHVIRDGVELYANIPLVDHNGLQVTVSDSCDIPTLGSAYEEPYVGTASCTIHDNRNMVLCSIDSFRAYWGHQVANVEFPNLYTSTRYGSDLTPSYTESFYLTGAAVNIRALCYQETSGLFGATYRMDHRYITFGSGQFENLDFVVQRGALDYGFTIPGAAVASIHIPDAAIVTNSRFNCNYVISTYNASGDNNGFAVLPVTVAGTPTIRSVDFTLDQATHATNIFSTIGAYCTNVTSTNFRTGKTQRCDATNLFTPVAIGLSTAGAGTYSLQSGKFERVGQWCHFTLGMAWSAHTGTGNLAITGLPYLGDADQSQAVSVYGDGLTIGAGYQVVGWIPNNQAVVQIRRMLAAGGAIDGVAMDTAVTELTVTGCYRISDAL
jgi:hypothetical protein